MKKIGCMFLFIGMCLSITGCQKEPFITIQPSIVQFDSYISDFSEINVVSASVFFESNQPVESAKIVSIDDLEGEGILDPAFVNAGFQEVNEINDQSTSDVYQLNFLINMKNGGTADFTSLQMEVNGETYTAQGEYHVRLNHAKEEFLERQGKGVIMLMDRIYLNGFAIPEEAENIRFLSSNEKIKINGKFEKEGENLYYIYLPTLEEPYMRYGTTMQIQYEINKETITKFLPEVRGDQQNLSFQ